MLNLFVLTLLILPLHLLGASTSKASEKKYCPSVLNQHGVIRFENDEKISYTAYGESCTQLKFADSFEHEDLDGIKTKQSALSIWVKRDGTTQFFASYCARRFAALEQQFEGK